MTIEEFILCLQSQALKANVARHKLIVPVTVLIPSHTCIRDVSPLTGLLVFAQI